jgi:predicted phage terminase large subunit-like protein
MPSWTSLIFKRVISFPENEQLWEEWRKVYRDISNENRFDDAWKFYSERKGEMLKGSRVLWEEKVPADKTVYPGGYYNVMLDRESFGEDAFFKEDQSEPRNSSDTPFKVQRYWQSLYDAPPKIANLKLSIDPSEGKGQDGTAYTLGGYLNGAVIVREGQLKNDKLDAIMQHVVWFIGEYPEIDEIVFEENTYKEDGTEQLRRYIADHNCYRKVTGFRSTDNKHNRILQMEPDMNNGSILFNNLNVEYNNQVLKYHAKAKHDDAADSLQALWKTLKTPNYYIK